jgi:hypothetical protein
MDKYMTFKRIIAFLAALGLWVISIKFSYNGFKFDSTTILWFGFVLAAVVTVVELVFNTKIGKLNPTLLVSGIVGYIYGIYTNVIGFYILQHGSLEGFWLGTNWVIPIFAGLIAEVLPEALLAWALRAGQEGDLLGNIFEMIFGKKTPKSSLGSSSPSYQRNYDYEEEDNFESNVTNRFKEKLEKSKRN